MILLKRDFRWLIAGIVASCLFICLTLIVKLNTHWISKFDISFEKIILAAGGTNSDQLFSIIAFFGSPIANLLLTMILAISIWVKQKNIFNLLWIMFVQVGGDALVLLFKIIIARPRPQNQVITDYGFSYPSGHTFSTAIFIFIILFIIVPLLDDQETQFAVSLLAIFWLGLVAFSRLYLRNHFPSDVLGSFFLAISWWELMRSFYLTLKVNFSEKMGE
jgi:undecaprenyl-diphosphatase